LIKININNKNFPNHPLDPPKGGGYLFENINK